eukprot:9713629-Prorocentrum_lima.AAC.1
MAHTGQVDGLTGNYHDGPPQDGSRRQEVKMMNGVYSNDEAPVKGIQGVAFNHKSNRKST